MVIVIRGVRCSPLLTLWQQCHLELAEGECVVSMQVSSSSVFVNYLEYDNSPILAPRGTIHTAYSIVLVLYLIHSRAGDAVAFVSD